MISLVEGIKNLQVYPSNYEDACAEYNCTHKQKFQCLQNV